MTEYYHHLNQGINQSQSHQYSGAIQSFSKAIQVNNNFTAAYLNHGALCNQSGLYDVAIEDFNMVIGLDSWSLPGYFNRFLSHFAKMDYLSALKDLYIAVSLAYVIQGELKNSMEIFNKALILVPNNVKALFGRAKLKRITGSCQDALQDINEAINIQQNYKDAFVERAAIYRKLGYNTKCNQDINRVLLLSKDNKSLSIQLSPRILSQEPVWIQSQIKQKYRIFMELRGVIFTKSQFYLKHLQMINNFSSVHQLTQRQDRNDQNIGLITTTSLSKIDRVEQALNKLKRNVDSDREELNRSLNKSLSHSRNQSGKKSRSQYSGSSVQRKKFVFTSGKHKEPTNILDQVDLKDLKQTKQTKETKQNKSIKQIKPIQQTKQVKQVTQVEQVNKQIKKAQEQQQIKSQNSIKQKQDNDTNYKKNISLTNLSSADFNSTLNNHSQPTSKSQITPKYKPPTKMSSYTKTKSTQSQQIKTIQIQIHKATILKSTQVIGKMHPYCVIKYGRQTNRTQVDKGSNPQWNQKFSFKYKSSRGLLTLSVFDKQTFKKDDFVGEAIISIIDGSTHAELKNQEEVIGTIEYDVKLS